MLTVAPKGFLNLELLESLLFADYEKSLEAREFCIDLSGVTWLQALSISQIFSWLVLANRAGASASLVLPSSQTHAGRWVRIAGVPYKFSQHNIDVIDPSPFSRGSTQFPLAVFGSFSSLDELRSYLGSLGDEKSRAKILRSRELPYFVAAGHFHDIVLRELAENTFFHGGGNSSHFVAFQARGRANERKHHHPIFADFSGKAYLEICVADLSESNLAHSLSGQLPSSYFGPNPSTDFHKLDKVERTILYAFEFDSTSQPERRRETLQHYLEAPFVDESKVSTGLYQFSKLANAYGGQIIVRAAGRLGTIDYSELSESSPLPRVKFWRNFIGSDETKVHGLASLPGTTLLLRTPIEPRASFYRSRKGRALHSSKTNASLSKVRVVAPTKDLLDARSKEFWLGLQERVQEALAESLQTEQAVVVLLDGISIDSKLLGGFIQLVALLPRYKAPLLLILPDPVFTEVATERWGQVLKERDPNDIRGVPALVTCSQPGSKWASYGDSEHEASTVVIGGQVGVLSSKNTAPLDTVLLEARRSYVASVASR